MKAQPGRLKRALGISLAIILGGVWLVFVIKLALQLGFGALWYSRATWAVIGFFAGVFWTHLAERR